MSSYGTSASNMSFSYGTSASNMSLVKRASVIQSSRQTTSMSTQSVETLSYEKVSSNPIGNENVSQIEGLHQKATIYSRDNTEVIDKSRKGAFFLYFSLNIFFSL